MANRGVVFRQGDTGLCWYIVFSGSVDVMILDSETATVVRHEVSFSHPNIGSRSIAWLPLVLVTTSGI